jgi:hypothetical protein
MLTRRFVFVPPSSSHFLRAGRGVSTYHGYLLAISRLGDHVPCVYHMSTGPMTYKGPWTRRGSFISLFTSFTLSTSILSTRSIADLVLKSIARSEFRSSPLKSSALVLSDIPTSITDTSPCPNPLTENYGSHLPTYNILSHPFFHTQSRARSMFPIKYPGRRPAPSHGPLLSQNTGSLSDSSRLPLHNSRAPSHSQNPNR